MHVARLGYQARGRVIGDRRIAEGGCATLVWKRRRGRCGPYLEGMHRQECLCHKISETHANLGWVGWGGISREGRGPSGDLVIGASGDRKRKRTQARAPALHDIAQTYAKL